MQLKRFLESQYPDFQNGNITGMTQPPTLRGEIIAQIISFIWLAGIALMIGGNYIFQTLNIPEPSWYQHMQENKMGMYECRLYFRLL